MTAPESHRATQDNGPPVINHELVWTSATGITTADPHSFGGCLRKWYYDYVEDKKAPATEAMKGGTALHAEIESHLTTGAQLTSAMALTGRAFIPHPGNGLFIEKPILFHTRDGVPIYGHVDLYNLRQQYIDENGVLTQDPPWSFEVKDWKTTSDFQYAKTKDELAKNIQLVTYAEAGFRTWTDLEHARLTHVYFLTKGRPASKIVTIRRTREEIAMRWDYSESVVRTMRDAARATSADHVTANRSACSAYKGCPHRGICSEHNFNSLNTLYAKIGQDFKEPHALQGPAAAQGAAESVQQTFQSGTPRVQQTVRQGQPAGDSQGGAASVLPEQAGVRSASEARPLVPSDARVQLEPRAVAGTAIFSAGQVPGVSPGVRLDRVETESANVGTFALGYAFQGYHVSGLQSASRPREGQHTHLAERSPVLERTMTMGIIASNPQIMNQLAAEEQQQRAQVAQQQQAVVSPQDLAVVCQRINAHGRGFPKISGNAAQPYAVICGATQPVAPGFVFKGIGNLESVELSEVAHFFQLANDLDAQRANQAPPPPPAFVPPTQMTQQMQVAPPAPYMIPIQAVNFLPPNAPESMPQLAAAQPSPEVQASMVANAAYTAAAMPAAEPEKPKGTRGRPKKDKDAAPEAVATVAAQVPPASAPVTQAAPATVSALHSGAGLDSGVALRMRAEASAAILVNARFPNRSTKSLASYVEYINAKVSQRYSVNDDGTPGVQDVRAAPPRSALGFGAWKGVVRECVKADPPPEGDYHFDTFGDELNEIVAGTLEVVAESKGWLFVRGVR